MSSKAEKFRKAANIATSFKTRPPNDKLLELYSLYKQATVGDNNTSKPSSWDIKGSAKWDSWNARKGMTKEQAMDKYVKLVDSMKKYI